VFELDNITGGIGELDFFDNIAIIRMFKLNDITEGI
jgi:hypothetical protein